MSMQWSTWHEQHEWDAALKRIGRSEPEFQPVLREFVDWSRCERGLQSSTIHQSLRYVLPPCQHG